VTEEESGHTPGTRERAPGVACNALDGPQDEPGGRSAGLGFAQGDRRAPSRLAAGDESPMNPHERRVQRAFSRGLLALLCSARCYPMNGAPNPISEPAREGPNNRKKGEYFSANRPPTHSGE
jgi:hypothetical protein